MSIKDDVRLFVIIPVYGNWEDTLECLRDLGRQSVNGFQLLIADDGFPLEPPSEISDFSFAQYFRYPHRGFAGTANAAAFEAIGKGATHLLFLNSDTSFSAAFIEGWLRTVRRIPDVILSPVVYWFRKPSRIWYSGGRLSIWLPFFRFRRDYREVTEVDIVCGCALLVPSECWKKLDGFSERYVMYYEDFDLTLRAKDKGMKTFVVPDPDLRVWHKVAGSFRGTADWSQNYHLLTSSLIFIRSHYAGISKLMCIGLTGIQICVMLFRDLPRTPHPRRLWQAVTRGFSVQPAASSRAPS